MPMWVATGNDIGNPSMDTLAQWISSAETEMNVLHGHYESKHSVVWSDLRPNLPISECFCIGENELVVLMFCELICTLECHEIGLHGKRKLNALNERLSIGVGKAFGSTPFTPGLAWR